MNEKNLIKTLSNLEHIIESEYRRYEYYMSNDQDYAAKQTMNNINKLRESCYSLIEELGYNKNSQSDEDYQKEQLKKKIELI